MPKPRFTKPSSVDVTAWLPTPVPAPGTEVLPTVADVAEAVRTGRRGRRWTHTQLARRAGVEVSFVADLEAALMQGGPAVLADVLAVLDALGIHASVMPSIPSAVRSEDVDLKALLRRYRDQRPDPPAHRHDV